MPDIIHLLPDSIANQIAAGEVIQRPASVVKELVENSLDAGASHIRIYIKDAGRTLIQVIDDGKGMSGTDVRMAFERHATSKIKNADDLFSLTTMGFRGEALPSIAAISQIEVKSRREEDELGTLVVINGSRLEKQELISCAEGTSVSVKNIFFNVPARRKFLKSNETERRNIFSEIERIALVNPDIEFTLVENDLETLHLPKAGLRQRIVQLEGKSVSQQLIEINEETTLGKIHGYVARPEFARKGRASQFFFVNNRYIRHPYFHRAVMTAFEPLIAANEKPGYYIYLQVDPDTIDVNIHPTKTEVKFENEQALWQILMVTVKESLGKFNAIPSIDFDTDDAPEIPIYDPSRSAPMPRVNVNSGYNPFHNPRPESKSFSPPAFGWEQLYQGFEKEKELKPEVEIHVQGNLFKSPGTNSDHPETELYPEHYQYKQKYILTSVKSGLMIIDQHKAHVRILFDRYMEQIRHRKGVTQRVLFPEVLELSAAEAASLPSLKDDLEALGFELSHLGNHSFAVQGVPSEIENLDAALLIRTIIGKSMETGSDVKAEIQESMALSFACMTAIPYGRILTSEEMLLIVSQLFASKTPTYTPDGQRVISMISDQDIEKRLQ
ncbi:DNA mismatch repair endonuclease MutL [Proteiniphilum sp. UBA1028]|jgi:DNA mismatch repair protein MutL|uniref:DNA mismatch repair endonuclease MutL n=1 Tax=Proteiniphilum sp. UBA1028 TaxID=1947251 RepID=UPI000E8FFC2C|nr:DNA mismatch repair endonuclease MutL [Proteiniphilum sp. UBA1028]HBG56741.1 DNA mismatch repair endonuclease MutL [Porphyromonadaceae bacterium]